MHFILIKVPSNDGWGRKQAALYVWGRREKNQGKKRKREIGNDDRYSFLACMCTWGTQRKKVTDMVKMST